MRTVHRISITRLRLLIAIEMNSCRNYSDISGWIQSSPLLTCRVMCMDFIIEKFNLFKVEYSLQIHTSNNNSHMMLGTCCSKIVIALPQMVQKLEENWLTHLFYLLILQSTTYYNILWLEMKKSTVKNLMHIYSYNMIAGVLGFGNETLLQWEILLP